MQNARDGTLKLTTQRGQVQYEIKSILNYISQWFHEIFFMKSTLLKVVSLKNLSLDSI